MDELLEARAGFQAKAASHLSNELGRMDGFHQDAIGIDPRHHSTVPSRHDEDGNFAGVRLLLKLVQNILPRDVRQPEIQHNEAGRP